MWQPRKWGTKAILARMRMRDRKNKQTVIRFIHEYWWRYLFDNISAPPFLCRAKRSFRDLCILWELSYYFHIQKWFFFTNCLLERSKCPALEWCWSILLYWCISNCQKSFVHWYLLELLYDFHHFLQTKWQIRRRQLFMFEKSIVFFQYPATMLNGIKTINCGKLESNAEICIQFAKEAEWKWEEWHWG